MTTDLLVLLLPIATLLVGVGVGWTLARSGARRDADAAAAAGQSALAARQALFDDAARRLMEAEQQLTDLRRELLDARAAAGALREDNARLQSALAHQEEVVPRQVALLQNAEAQLKASFDALAASALRASTDEFLKLADQKLGHLQKDALGEFERRQQSFDALVAPIRQVLTQVDQKLADSEKQRLETSAVLQTMIRQVGQGQELLRSETQNLVRALRTPNVRGRWGEVQLRRVIELAGMLPYCDFDEQPSLIADSGRQRPDLIIKLPGGRTVVVDAKVPLEAYLDASETTNEAVRGRRMLDHARQVREHMSKLGAKSYWEQVQPSPEFVVMFLPGEAFFQAALQHDPELIDFGVRCQVYPASPITLIALLQVIAQGWRQERLARNAEEIQALGRDLYARVAKMTEYLDTLRTRLDSTVKAFNETVGSYENRVLVTARRFKELGVTSGTEIDPLQTIDTVPRILQTANLLALPDDVAEIIDGETVIKDTNS